MENSAQNLLQEIDELRIRLQEAEETLAAIRAGEVDALVVTGPAGERIFTLAGADHPYRIIVEEMNEAALTLSLDGTVLYCNSRFAELVQASLERVIGSSFGDFVAAGQEVVFRDCLDSREKTRARLELRASDGARVPVHLSCSRVVIDQNDIICLIVTDLSEQKRHETNIAEERRQAEEKLRANDRLAAIGTTAAVLAHEIANPLNWISTSVQLMQRELTDQRTQVSSSWSEQLDDIQQEINRLGRLLQEFRSFARPAQLNVTAVHLENFIAEMEKTIRPELEGTDVRLEHHLSTALPPVSLDREKMKQVFFNLYKNAIEAMPSGGKITVKAAPEPANVIIEISDTGTGIPEDMDIFAPFATTKDKGTGLGLMVVRQIVAAHDGSIAYRSKSGEGTTFRIVLPLTGQSPAGSSSAL